jgi:hypothetical protein
MVPKVQVPQAETVLGGPIDWTSSRSIESAHLSTDPDTNMASEGGPYPVSPRRSSFDSDTHSDSPAKPLMHDIHNPAHKLNPWIIHPNHPRYVTWTYVINVFVFWSSFAAPYVWAMLPDPSLGYCIYEAVVGALFAVDMVMRLGFLAYVEKQKYTLVQDRKKIAIRWGSGIRLTVCRPDFVVGGQNGKLAAGVCCASGGLLSRLWNCCQSSVPPLGHPGSASYWTNSLRPCFASPFFVSVFLVCLNEAVQSAIRSSLGPPKS